MSTIYKLIVDIIRESVNDALLDYSVDLALVNSQFTSTTVAVGGVEFFGNFCELEVYIDLYCNDGLCCQLYCRVDAEVIEKESNSKFAVDADSLRNYKIEIDG